MAELWTPAKGVTLIGPRKFLASERVITLDNGERVAVRIDESGTVRQVEHDHSLDGTVRPKTVRLKLRKVDG